MSRHTLAACFVVGCTVAFPLTCRAQQFGSPAALYDSGVEAYFRGCSPESESYFTSLMGQDPNDPRAFYFRALSEMRQGREDEARSDMEIGAEIESRFPHRFDIGKMLERVQGPSRLLLEQYRSRARANASMSPPIGATRAPDTGMLREQRVVPLDEFARPGEPQSFPPPVAPQTPLPAKPVLPPAPPRAAAEPSAPVGGNPFGDDATDAAPKSQPKAPPAKPEKAASPEAKAKLPPPKPAAPAPAPKPADDDSGNPF